MQFIDQSPAYRVKSISLDQAVLSGRATFSAVADSAKLSLCFQPTLKAALAFDRDIDARVNFQTLPTAQKLDLMIQDLLPSFFNPDLLTLTGRDQWIVRFVIDANVVRTLRIDSDGIRPVSGKDWTPHIELETDIMTLMSILRSTIADFEAASKASDEIVTLTPEEATAIVGGMPAPDAEQSENSGNEGDEGDEFNENDEGDEGNEPGADEGNEGDEVVGVVDDEGNEGNENDEGDETGVDDGNEGNEDTPNDEGDEGDEAALAFVRGGFACGADGGLDDGDACGADACAIDAGGAKDTDDLDDVIGADLGAGLDDLDV